MFSVAIWVDVKYVSACTFFENPVKADLKLLLSIAMQSYRQ